MLIWLISPHDAIPGDSWGQRHVISLAKTLSKRGHDVVYWASSFSHAMKRQRGYGWQKIQVEPRIRVILVPTPAYKKNVGLGRIWFLKEYARKLWVRCKTESRPDVLITSVGTPFLDSVIIRLSQFHKTFLITEFRDLWPDIFSLAFPMPLRGVSNILLWPFYRERRLAFQSSHAVTAVCNAYLKYAQAIAPNVRHIPARVMYHSGIRLVDFQEKMQCNECDAEMPVKQPGEVWAIYAGTLGNNYDVPALLEAVRVLSQKPEAGNIKFVIAGDGPMRPMIAEFKNEYALMNLIYVGVLDITRLCHFYAKADIGLSVYAKGSTVVIPAKAYDYYAAELPIVNSLKGEFADFLHENDIGTQYEAGNPISLANAIYELANDQSHRDSMRLRLRAIAPQFDQDRQYDQIYDLLPTNTL